MNSKEYEKFIANCYVLLLCNDLIHVPSIHYLKKIKGKSGELYEVDISYNFRVANSDYLTIIECKHWNKKVGRIIVNSFKNIVDDIGAHKGIIITTVGFQKGAIQLASKYGIGLLKMSEKKNLEVINYFTGPTQEIINFLVNEDIKYQGGSIQRLDGIITCRYNVYQYIENFYGKELATILADDEIKSIEQIINTDYASILRKQLSKIKNDWLENYFMIENCCLPLSVEPAMLFRLINLKIHLFKSGRAKKRKLNITKSSKEKNS